MWRHWTYVQRRQKAQTPYAIQRQERDVKRRTKYVKKSEVNALAVKKIKRYLKQKKKAKKTTNELRNFEKLSVSSEEEDASMKSISSGSLENLNDSDLENMSPFTGFKPDDEWKVGSDEIFVVHDTTSSSKNKKIKLGNEMLTCLDDCINSNFNYESIRSRLASQAKNKNRMIKEKIEDLVPIVFGTIVQNKSHPNGHTVNRVNLYPSYICTPPNFFNPF